MKYMKIKLLTSSFILLMLSSCLDDTTTNNGATSFEASTPTVLSTGTEIAFNPKITVTSLTACTYDNTVNTDSKLPATTGAVECNMTVSPSGSSLTVTIENLSLFGADNLVITLNGFVDKGGDGHTDQFSVTAETGVTPTTGATSVVATGQFVGTTKPRNENVSDANVVDISDAPTKEQWNSYIVGNILNHIDYDGDNGLVEFSTNSATYTELTPEDDGSYDSGVIDSYTYQKTSPTTGLLKLDDTWTESSDNSSWEGSQSIELTFTSFYSGTYKEISDYEKNLTTGVESKTTLGGGTFNIYTDASLLLTSTSAVAGQ